MIRLHVLIDGQPADKVYQSAWDDYLKALFRQLDKDGDGFLSEAEGQRLPPPSQQVGAATGRPTNLAFNFRVVDTSGDGKIDLAEAAAYYRDYGNAGIALSLAPILQPVPAGVNDDLFARLDTNKDGRLTRDELVAATKLIDLDADGDELLSPPEIAPRLFGGDPSAMFRRVPTPAAPRAGRPQSSFVLRGGDGLEKRLRERYGDDVEALLNRPAAELRVRLGQLAANEKSLEVIVIDPKVLDARLTSTGFALRLAESRTALLLQVNDGRPAQPPDIRRQLLDQFHAADVGRKGHVALKDAQLRNFYPQQFPLLDRDMNGQLAERELVDYLEQIQDRQARAVTSVVSLLASEAAVGLFDLLDANRDGRLAAAELSAAPRLLDLAGVEALQRAELPRTYHLATGLCVASFNRTGGHGAFTPRGLPMLALDWSRPQLVWFHKMDRNRDGHVSLREFLGPESAFRRLDGDGDGLISPDEALAARID